MTRKELEFIKTLLSRIKPQDGQVNKALAYVDKDIAQFESRKGQLREQYDYEM